VDYCSKVYSEPLDAEPCKKDWKLKMYSNKTHLVVFPSYLTSLMKLLFVFHGFCIIILNSYTVCLTTVNLMFKPLFSVL
jgi:hypothetical protein